MTLFTRLFAAAFLTVFAGGSASAEDNKVSDICAEAEERYVEMMEHPSAEADGVTVVTMYKYNFCPAQITVPVGTTVRWVNVDKRTSHSVLVQNSGVPESDRVFSGENVEFTFMLPGPQDYLCGPHWEVQNMIGRVTVVP